jgi:homocysteine S-methyltransferase
MLTFLQRLADPHPILMDGATGTELERRGLDTGTPIWSAMALLEAPQMVEAVHRDYLDAGAEIILTNTFRTHQRSLDKLGMGEEAGRLTSLAVAIAQKAVRTSGRPAWVAGSMGPLEDSYTPFDQAYEDFLREHQAMANNLAAAGADLLLVETMNTIKEAQAAAEAAASTGLPFGVSFVCNANGELLSGEPLAEAVAAVEPFGPSFLSINCTPAPSLHLALDALRAATELPIGVYANPGHTEDYEHWGKTEATEPPGYAIYAADWLSQGARLVGGCCGTRPEHIAELRKLIRPEEDLTHGNT